MAETTEQRLYKLMEQLDARPDATVPVTKGLLVISTPRSGSSMYCDTLSKLSVTGECREWFNLRYLGAYAKLKGQKDVDFPAYLDFITKKTTQNTGVLAVNMHVEQYSALLKYKLDVFNLNFGSIVYLERKDKLAQAVSLSKAQITDQWSAQTQAVKELPANIPHSHITKSLLHLIESHEYYLNHLAPKTHFHYDYETFKSLDSLTCYQEPLAKLGIEIPQSVSLETGLTQQANKQSDEIKANYLSFINGN